MKRATNIVGAIAVLLIVAYEFRDCIPYRMKLAEKTFFKNAHLELKVIFGRQNLPLHYKGPLITVACRSANTKQAPALKYNLLEAGWAFVPFTNELFGIKDDDQMFSELVAAATKGYVVSDSNILTFKRSSALTFSFDACDSFPTWDLKDYLPASSESFVTPEFEACRKNEVGDCLDRKVLGKNRPIYDRIIVDRSGRASFRVSAPALGDVSLHVTTNDAGRTWRVEQLPSM